MNRYHENHEFYAWMSDRRAPRTFPAHGGRQCTLVQRIIGTGRAAGHADPSTTKLYDRRGHNPERSASVLLIIEGPWVSANGRNNGNLAVCHYYIDLVPR